MSEGLGREGCALLESKALPRHCCEHVGITSRRRDDRDVGVVLRRGAHHCRTANVDLLNTIIDAGARRNGLGERIQVYDNEFEGSNAQFVELLLVGVLAQVGEETTVDLRVQGLHATVEALRETGDIRHLSHSEAGIGNGLCGGTSGDHLDTSCRKTGRQLDKTRLVIDRHECATDGTSAHCCAPISCVTTSTRSRRS